MTYNKAQGQTLESVLLDVTSPPFAHGHLYVALSRVTHYANIKVYCNETSIMDNAPLLSNVVFPELIPD
jgi:ATP-dependent exoDNAse (exonuclease V) alpha subunit